MKILRDMEKCLKHIFFLKLLALKLESDRRHLVCNQIKNKIYGQDGRQVGSLLHKI